MKALSLLSRYFARTDNDSAISPVLVSLAASLLIILFSVTFAFSPINGEDYALGLMDNGQSLTARLSWFAGHASRQWWGWNARLGEMLSIFWLAMPKPAFDVAAILSMVLFCTLISVLALKSTKLDRRFLLTWTVAVGLLYILWPRYEVFFWRTATAGYLFPLTFVMLLVAIVSVRPLTERVYKSKLLYSLSTFLAVLCGLSFENLPPLLVMYVAANWYFSTEDRDRRDHATKDAGIILALFAGWAALMLAPSTSIRTQWYRDHLNYAPTVWYSIRRIGDVIAKFVVSSAITTVLGFVALGLLIRKNGVKSQLDILVLLIPATLCVLSLVVAPYTEPRAFAFAWTVAVVTCARFLVQFANTTAFIAIFLLALANAAITLPLYISFNQKVSERDTYIRQHIGSDACTTGLQISPIVSPAWASRLKNRDNWVKGTLHLVSEYYGCTLVMDNTRREPLY